MQLGAVEYLTRGADELETFRRARRLGFEGIEVILARQDLMAPGQERLGRLKRAQAASGLATPSLMLSEHNEGGLANADAAVAQAAIEDIRRALDWAAELGASIILVPFFFRGEITDDADFERAVAAFRALCPQAQARGVTLCYEGTLPAREILRLIEQVGSPAFGCYFDLANVVWRGMDSATEIRSLGSAIRQVHMKETRVGAGDVPPGLGLVHYGESARALGEAGFDGWLVLETPAGPPPLVARDISFTRRFFPQLGATAWPRFGTIAWDFGRGELEQLIERFGAYGLSAVQLGGGLLEEAIENPATIETMRARFEEAGIEVVGLAGYRNLVAPNPARRAGNIGFIKRCLEVAPQLGTTVVATESGTLNPQSDWLPARENWGAEAWRLLDQALEELLPVAERHGAILALEGYVNNVLQTTGQLLGLLDRFPSQHLQVVCDPYNYLSSHLLPARERIADDFLDRFEHRFVLAHLKDVSAEGAEAGTPEFGEGVFAHRRYLEFLRARRPELPIILEHLPLDHIPAAIRRVDELMRET